MNQNVRENTLNAQERLRHALEAHDAISLSCLFADLSDEDQLKVLAAWRQAAGNEAFAGNTEQAQTIARLVTDVSHCLGSQEARALSFWTHGNIHAILGNAKAAYYYYCQAEDIYNILEDPLNLARMQVGVVGILNRLGDFAEACRIARAAYETLADSQEPADRQRLAGLANNLAIAYEFQGRYQEAIELYDRKINLWKYHPNRRQAAVEIARTHLNLGIIKKHLNLWDEARSSLDYCHRVLTAPALAGKYPTDLERVRLHLAHLQAKKGVSVTTVETAFADTRALITDPQNLLLLTLYEVEWTLENNRVSSQLLATLRELYAHYRADGYTRDALRVKMLIAYCEMALAYFSEAEANFEEGQRAAQEIDDWELQYMAWHGLGLLNLEVEDFPKAEAAFLKAINIIENVSQTVKSRDLRIGFRDDKLAGYRDLTWLHLLQDDMDQVFHWVERGHAQELVRSFSLDSGDLEGLTSEEAQLRSLITQTRQRLKIERHSERRQYLENHLIELTRRLDQKALPEPAALIGKMPTLSGAMAALPPDMLMLVYFTANRKLWVLPVTAQAVLPAVKLNMAVQGESLEQELASLHSVKGYPLTWVERHYEQLITAAQQPLGKWYQAYLQPLNDLLKTYSHLLIVLDDFLYRLPFHAFYDDLNGRYLIETHEVSYTSSVTAWLATDKRSPVLNQGLILSYAGSQLHHTADEVKAILTAYPDFKVFSGQKGTKHVLETPFARESALIHIATHAIFRPDNPMFSYIELADDRLNMLDILHLKLNADLVVLSACESGRGLLRGGEYLCLPYAFLMAGSRLVLATHWPVDDLATSLLMSKFYQNLADGHSFNQALRQAQTDFLNIEPPRYRHPYYWAPFFMLGGHA